MTWNKKNDQYALSCGLTRQSTLLMLRWILRRAKLNQVDEIEIDLRIFNAWVAKNRGRPFDPKTIREAIAQLDEKTQGLVLITKSYTPWIKKILVRPLETVLQNNAQEEGKRPKLKTGNPMYSDDHKKRLYLQQQQDISKLGSIFKAVGLRFTPDNVAKLWVKAGKSLSDMKLAIEYLLHAHSTQKKPIDSGEGFLTDCLNHGWHKGFNLLYRPELPKFSSRSEIANFVDALVAPT